MLVYTLNSDGYPQILTNGCGIVWIYPKEGSSGTADISSIVDKNHYMDYYPKEGHVRLHEIGHVSYDDPVLYNGRMLVGCDYGSYYDGFGYIRKDVDEMWLVYRGINRGSRVGSVRHVWADCNDTKFGTSEERWAYVYMSGYPSADAGFAACQAFGEAMIASVQGTTPNAKSTGLYWTFADEKTYDFEQKIRVVYDTLPEEDDWTTAASEFGWPASRRILNACDNAYVDAATKLPQAACNSIANVLQVADYCIDIAHGDLKGISGLSDLWLRYRYEYNTTKSDIAEYIEITKRILDLCNAPTVTAHGASSFGNYTVRCSFDVDCSKVIPQDTADWFSKYGFDLTLYNVWDMIPYSFVVDWFVNVGGIIENLENAGNAAMLHPTNCFASITANDNHYYLRFPYEYSYSASILADSNPSTKTTLMRVADAIALFH
jgi:hypothetical protein